jgi:SAM-dependent methyltransferase
LSSEPAHGRPPSLLRPEEFANWRASWLGSRTEQIEQDAVFHLAGPLRSKRVLEVGCGDGLYSIAASVKGAHVRAVDISAPMLFSARRRAEHSGSIVEWCQASAERLPFKSNVFDIVIAVTSLCFIKDPQPAVNEAARVLRPGGVFIIGELGKFSWWALSRTIRSWLGSAKWRRAHFWSLPQLRRLVIEAGLVFHSGGGAVYYPPMASIARLMNRHDRIMSRLGQIGAAFRAVRADKPG